MTAPHGIRPSFHGHTAEQMSKRAECCAGKAWFKTHSQAKAVARRNRRRYGHPFEPYECSICLGFHLTTTRKKP